VTPADRIEAAAERVRTERAAGRLSAARAAESELAKAYAAKRAAAAEERHGTADTIKRRARMEMELSRQSGA